MIRALFPTIGDVVAALAWLSLVGLWFAGSRQKSREREWSGIDRHEAARRALAAPRCPHAKGRR